MVIEYKLWSSSLLEEALDDFSKGKLPCLDLEFSSKCNLKLNTSGCIYCDSFDKVGKKFSAEMNLEEIKDIIDQGIKLGLKWVYICGLGEPKDDPKLYDTVSYLHENGIKVSMFSNGVNFSDFDIKFFHDRRVNLIIKCDSLNPRILNEILGGKRATDQKIAESIYFTIDRLIKVGYSQNKDEPDLALSLVPTKINIDHILEVVIFCKQWNLFPLIGELEKAGKAAKKYEKLTPTKSQMEKLALEINKILEQNYEVPICPATITSLHINNIGDYVVHKASGSSCPWFFMEEPEVEIIGNIRKVKLETALNQLILIRQQIQQSRCLSSEKKVNHIFGGCSGLKTMNFLIKENRRN